MHYFFKDGSCMSFKQIRRAMARTGTTGRRGARSVSHDHVMEAMKPTLRLPWERRTPKTISRYIQHWLLERWPEIEQARKEAALCTR